MCYDNRTAMSYVKCTIMLYIYIKCTALLYIKHPVMFYIKRTAVFLTIQNSWTTTNISWTCTNTWWIVKCTFCPICTPWTPVLSLINRSILNHEILRQNLWDLTIQDLNVIIVNKNQCFFLEIKMNNCDVLLQNSKIYSLQCNLNKLSVLICHTVQSDIYM